VLWSRRPFIGSRIPAHAGAYTSSIEPQWLEFRRLTVPVRSGLLTRPVRVLHLSDLHAAEDESLDFIAHAIDTGLTSRPDLIAVTGDFISGRIRKWDAYARLLSRLSQQAPTFAVTGNHDGGSWSKKRGGYYDHPYAVIACLRRAHIRVLDNANDEVESPGGKISLVGVSDLWTDGFDPDRAFQHARNDGYRILLAHNPDSKDSLKKRPWNLMLSGHTHGGQVVIPFVGPPFAPVIDQRFVEGLHEWEGRHLFVSRGVGSHRKMRINCRPDIALLTLEPA